MSRAHLSRSSAGFPHGLPCCSRLVNAFWTSGGNSDFMRTSPRRSSTTFSTTSIIAGHSRSHAPQVVQDQISSGESCPSPVPTISGSSAPSAFGRRARAMSRRSFTIFLGESGLPVMFAGQTSVQRPHSTQLVTSRRCGPMNWSIVRTPKRSASSMFTMGRGVAPAGMSRARKTLAETVKTCPIATAPKSPRNQSEIARCPHHRTKWMVAAVFASPGIAPAMA